MEYMTSKERMKTTMAFQEPDRVPVFITALSHPSRVIGVTISEMRKNPELAAQAVIKTSQVYETDCVYIYQDYGLLLGDITGIEVKIPQDSPPSIQGFPLRDMKTWDDFQLPEFPEITDPPQNLQTLLESTRLTCLQAGTDIFTCFCVAGPFTLAALLRGVENLCMDIYDNPDGVKELISACTTFSLRTLIAGITQGATMASIADPTASPNVISPAQFEEFAKPPLKTLIEGLHSAFPEKDIPVRLHICGDTTPIHDLMMETGADILSLDQAVDLQLAKECTFQQVCLMGNVDPSRLYQGTPEEIKELSKKCIEDAGEGGGFILASGCEIPPDCPSDNVKMLIKAARTYGTYGEGTT
jgi:uroporphyrinogen decarboxylase